MGLLTAAADAQPLLCVVDDAHWLDGASAEALVFVARRLQADPIAVLIGARDGDARPLRGARAARAAARRAARRRRRARCSTAPCPRSCATSSSRVTGGNPLALLELPGALTDDERTGRAPLRLDLPLNERIERAFMARVEPLADDARRMLLLAAADDSGDVGTLLRAAERIGFGPDALDAVERAGLLTVEGPRLRFRHPLRALGRLPRRGLRRAPRGARGARRRARRRAPTPTGARGTSPPPPPRRTTTRPRRWSGRPTTLRAAAGTRPPPARSSAPRSSTPTRSGARGTSSPRPAPRRWRGASAMRWRCLIAPSPTCGDPMARGIAMRVRGMASMAIGRPADAYAHARRRGPHVLPADRPAGLGLLMRACMAAAVSGDPGAIHGMLAELDTEPRSDAERFPSRIMNGISRLIAGDAAAGAASIEEALALADDLEIVEQVQQAGGGAIFVGDWVRARRYFDRAILLARDRGAIAVLLETLGLARGHRPVGAPAGRRRRRRG